MDDLPIAPPGIAERIDEWADESEMSSEELLRRILDAVVDDPT